MCYCPWMFLLVMALGPPIVLSADDDGGTEWPSPVHMNNSGREKRGFFDKEKERQRMEEEYDKSFRLFWLLGGLAILVFICIFVLTLLCFCCPFCHAKRGSKQGRAQPQTPVVTYHSTGGTTSDVVESMEARIRSASIVSCNNASYLYPRLSQEQVNSIQNRRSSNLQLPSTSQGLSPAVMDVSVFQENTTIIQA